MPISRRCIDPLGRKGGRHAVKNDNLSFLRVGLAQTDSVQGGTNGLTPLFEGGWPGPSRALLFDLQQCAWPLSEGAQGLFCFLPKRGYLLAHNDLDVATLDKYARTKYFVRVQFDAGSK